ncbi:MAG: class I SAM-dependent methyltransferase [Dehalococcoidia bacterium]
MPDPVDALLTVRAGYDRIADAYLAARTRESEDVQLLDDFIGRLPAGAKVLDAGCGAGVPIAAKLSERFDVLGIDFSASQLARARINAPKARFLLADLTRLPLVDASLDGICSYYAIIHIPRQYHRALLTAFGRALKPGGLALLCLGASDNVDDRDEYLGTPMYWSHFDASTYLRLLPACGFDVIWSRVVADASCGGPSGHLFVLAKAESALLR